MRSRTATATTRWIPAGVGIAIAIAIALLVLAGLPAAPRASQSASTGDTGSTGGGTLSEATFAGGCFWCMEHAFDEVEGVVETVSGYTGGEVEDPTYRQVSAGATGHAEAVRVRYDPQRITYEELLDIFWHNIDPLTADRQFCDAGSQYRSAIFYHDERQQRLAEGSREALARSGRFDRPIVTEIEPAGAFYRAEAYHQDYHQKNPVRYQLYRFACGRDDRLEALWGESG